MTTQDAIAGRLRFAGDGIGNATGALTVQGNIIARGGDVVLIAPNVELAQTAVVEAQGGSVVLAAGQSVEVTGRGLEGITLQVQAPTDQAINLGTLNGDAVGIFAGTLKHSGLIQATQAALEGGRVVLKASGDAYVEGSGRIDATSSNGKGGTIQVLGNRVAVTDNAALDASGKSGGGTVLVGGDYQGKNAGVQNAEITYFGSTATLKADGLDNGNGGKVIVWANDTTRAYGSISVRGGANGGDGGFVETSGKVYLDVQRAPDIAAPAGKGGTWLLDPSDINIVSSGGGFQITGPSLFTPTQTDGTASQIMASTIDTALVSGDVIIDTLGAGTGNGNITVSSNIANTATAARTLTLRAANDITVTGNITSATNSLNVVLNANSDAIGTGAIVMTAGSSIVSNGGNITLGGGANPLTTAALGNSINTSGVKLTGATLNAGAGNISIRGAGVNGIPSINSGVEIVAGSQLLTTSGAINLVGLGGAGGGAYGNKYGIYLNDGTIQSATGSIALDGTGGSNGTFSNIGVYLDGGTISSVTSAPITITGNGGASTTGPLNYGVMLGGGAAGLTVSSVTGVIAITGTGTGNSSQGIRAFGGGQAVNVLSTGSAAINLTASGSGTYSSFDLDGSSGAITIGGASDTGDIGFVAGGTVQDIAIGTGVSIRSTGNLALRPLVNSTAIGIGGGAGVFDLTTTELASITNGFASITVGSAAQTGAIAVGSAIFNDNLTLRSSGGISIGTDLTSAGNLVTLNGGGGGVSGGGAITANQLQVLSSGNVNLSGTNLVNSFAADMNSAGNLLFENGQSLLIANVNGTNGVDFSGNTGSVSVRALVGNLTVNAPVNAGPMGGGGILLEAQGALALNAAVTSSFNADPGGPVRLVAGAGGISSAVGGAITTNAIEIVSAGGVSLLAPGNDLRGVSGGPGVLAGNVTGSGFSFSSSNSFIVGTVGGTSGLTVANGDISLTAAGLNRLLTISNNVQASGGNVVYIADNLSHNAFTTTFGGIANFAEVRPFTAATVIEFSPAADSAGVMRLSSGELQFSTPLLKLGNSAMSGGITLQTAVTAVNFPSLSLITGGSITQAAGSILTVANLNADGAAGVTLTELNAVSGKLAGRTNAGNFAFTNASGLVVDQVDINNGINSTSGNITLIAGGAASEAVGAIVNTLGTVAVTAVGGISFNNNNTGSIVNLNNSGSGNVSYVANQVNVNVSATNVAGGSISLQNVASGGLLTLGNASTGSGSVNVTAPGDLTLGTASTSGAVTISSGGGALVDGNGGTLNLTGGVINLSAGTGIGSGADLLDVNPSTSLNAITTAGNIYVAASGGLPLGLISAPGIVSLTANVAMTDANGAANNIAAASLSLAAANGIGSGDALETQVGTLTLVNNTTINNIALENTGALSLGSVSNLGGNWYIYMASPGTLTKNAVTSNFRHYGATASTYATPSESGNGFIYASAAPALSVATTLASGLASNTYGANPTAVYGYTLTGFADAEDNAGNIGVGGAAAFTPTIFSTSNAGVYTVNYATGLASTSGYTFAAGTGLAYSVTPAPLTISTTNVTKIYDAGLTALGTATVTSGTLFGADSINGGTFAFASKNVGAGNKTVSVTGVTVTDTNGGGNYTVSYANNANSTISPATLTIGASASNKAYDGNTTATVALSDNRFAGDVFATSYSTANFVDSSVANGKTVNVFGINAAGTDASNYTFNTTAVGSADITAGVAVSPAPVQTDLVVTFLEKFQEALQDQPLDRDAEDIDNDKANDNLVVEGETCKP